MQVVLRLSMEGVDGNHLPPRQFPWARVSVVPTLTLASRLS